VRHAHRRYVAPKGGNAPVVAVVLVFVLGSAGAIYYVMRPVARPTPATSAQASVAPTGAPPAPARGAAKAAGANVVGVDQEYDPRHDRMKVIARGIPLAEAVRDEWTLDVSWTNPGKAVKRPTAPIFWSVVHQGVEAAMKDDHRPRLVLDGKRLDVGAGDYGSQPKEDLTMEALRYSTTLDELLRVAAAASVSVETGPRTFELSAEALERLRGLVSLVPGP
jgi:hypothetical protein